MPYGDDQAKAAFIPSAIQTFSGLQGLQQNQQAMDSRAQQMRGEEIKLNQQQRRDEMLSKRKPIDGYLMGLGLRPESKTYKLFKDNYSGISEDGMISGYDVENMREFTLKNPEFGMGILNAQAEDATTMRTQAEEALSTYMKEKLRPGATADTDPKYANLLQDVQMAHEAESIAKAKVVGGEKAYAEESKFRREREKQLETTYRELKKADMLKDLRLQEMQGKMDRLEKEIAGQIEKKKTPSGDSTAPPKKEAAIETRIDNFLSAPEFQVLKQNPVARERARAILEMKDPRQQEREMKRFRKWAEESSGRKPPSNTDKNADNTKELIDKWKGSTTTPEEAVVPGA